MTRLERFDAWVAKGPFTPEDLGLYRIVYASLALLVVPDLTWLAAYPDFLLHPPLGPFQLLTGTPSANLLVGLEVVRTIVLVLLGLGVWTRWVSIAATAILVLTYGLIYSVGKIDHTILLVLTPLVLSFAHWGDRVSIDAWRTELARPQPQWPLRLLAAMIALPFFAVAFVKAGTGWLLWTGQAVHGQFLMYYEALDRTAWLAPLAAHLESRIVWETLDWLTVLVEVALLVTLRWWRAFRIALAFVVLFHLGVFLMLNISFAFNIVVYGAFVAWGARLPARRVWLCAPLVAVVVGLVVPASASRAAILFGATVIALVFLMGQLRDVYQSRSARV